MHVQPGNSWHLIVNLRTSHRNQYTHTEMLKTQTLFHFVLRYPTLRTSNGVPESSQTHTLLPFHLRRWCIWDATGDEGLANRSLVLSHDGLWNAHRIRCDLLEMNIRSAMRSRIERAASSLHSHSDPQISDHEPQTWTPKRGRQLTPICPKSCNIHDFVRRSAGG